MGKNNREKDNETKVTLAVLGEKLQGIRESFDEHRNSGEKWRAEILAAVKSYGLHCEICRKDIDAQFGKVNWFIAKVTGGVILACAVFGYAFEYFLKRK